MSEEGREGRAQQHYCRSCGAQTRPGDAFCTSCGQRFGPEPGASERVPPGNPTGQAVPTGEALGEKIRNLVGSLEGLWASHGGTLRGVPRSTVRWFRGLPGVAKLAILGLMGLGLLIILSPVALLAVALVFGASLIGLIVRSGQRAPLWGWGIIAAASFVLVIALAGVSGAPYGTGSSPRSAQDASSARTPEDATAEDEGGQYLYEVANLQTECRPMEHYTETVPASIPGYAVTSEQPTTMANGAEVLFVDVMVDPYGEGFLYVADDIVAQKEDYDAVQVEVWSGGAYMGTALVANNDRGAAATGLLTDYDGDTGACRYRLGF